MPLDHGTLNLPLAARGDINKQIDAFKADQHRNQRTTAKRLAEQRRIDKAHASALLAEYQAAIVTRHGARFGVKALKDRLHSMAIWEPLKLVTFVQRFIAEGVPA